jgi:NAD+ diphosphatase
LLYIIPLSYYIFFDKKSIQLAVSSKEGVFLNTGAFFFQGTTLLLKGDEPEIWEFSLDFKDFFPFSDVFSVPEVDGGGEISCVYVPPEAPLPPGWQAIPVRRALSLLPEAASARRMLRAFHVAQWRRESRFCGSCGGENTDSPEEIARVCPTCGRTEFPRITPAVIVIITNDEGEILLAHNKKFATGMYSLIAGFTEAGETLEAAVVRETREEVNIELCEICYIVSQPWPFPNSLMAGFSARYAGGVLRPDGVEIEDARWFRRDNLPELPAPGSLSRRLIDEWEQTIAPR